MVKLLDLIFSNNNTIQNNKSNATVPYNPFHPTLDILFSNE
jgi:hypothetical protein